jgi:branched-chain amino acid aminotransferase
MPGICGAYFSENFSFKKISSFSDAAFETGTCFYEVMRVMDGNCLFLEDHLNRLQTSVSLSGLKYSFQIQDVSDILKKLIVKNELKNGNIRLVLQAKEDRQPVLYTYCIPFSYPAGDLYEKGVPVAVFEIVRNNPNIKQYNPVYQKQVGDFIRERNIYEALLQDDRNCITEGSKSNVFFIRNECVMTAPGEKVLKGITREKVILLCKKLNYRLLECPISIDTLSSMEAVFLSGTSPKILPVNRIDHLAFSTGHPMLKKLMAGYERLILEDISRWERGQL